MTSCKNCLQYSNLQQELKRISPNFVECSRESSLKSLRGNFAGTSANFCWMKLYLYPLPNHFFQPDGSGCCLATGLSTLSPCESTTPTRTRLRLLWSVDSWDSRLKRRFKASCEENEFHGIKQKSNNSHGDNWVISCQMLSEIWNYFTVLSESSDFLILKGGSKYAWRLCFARCVHFCFYHEIHFKVHIQCLYNVCTFMYTVCS